MTSEGNLYSRFTAKKVTSKQIGDYLSRNQVHHMENTEDDVEVVWSLIQGKLRSEFMFDGKPKKEKIQKFLGSVEYLLQDFDIDEILKIRAECINENGSIDVNKFRSQLEH